MHGHSFHGEVAIRGPVRDPEGWVLDFADLQAILEPLVSELDHYVLNDISGLENPTSENLAVWIWRRLESSLPQLIRVTVKETCNSRCHYYGPPKHPIR